MRRVRIFISSPSDVQFERERVDRVAAILNVEAANCARFETFRWETKFYEAHATFQKQIPEAADCDIVIGIFGQRLGSRLPETFARVSNGEHYPSGSAYEVLSALEARRDGKPAVYVFRTAHSPTARLDRPQELAEAQEQWQRLEAFFARWFHGPNGEIERAYQFVNPDDFEDKLIGLLRDWLEQHVLGHRAVTWPIELKGSPFRSLQPFDAKHAAVYFGRDRKVGRAVGALMALADQPNKIPFLLIVGASGTGKSSLMRAGLAPRLTAPGLVRSVDGWRTAIMRLGDSADLFLALARALLVTGRGDDEGGFGRALPELMKGDYGSPEALAAVLESGAAASGPVVGVLDKIAEAEAAREGTQHKLQVNLLLLLDQFENIFAASVPDNRRLAFASLIHALCRTKRVWVVATVRADLYSRLLQPGGFIALKDAGGFYDLAAPGESELTEIVQKSAQAAGLVYDTDPETGEPLDERILADAKGENMLPVLQFTLDRLFQERLVVDDETRLTFEAYRSMGGLDGAIDKTAEDALTNLEPEAIAALPRLLRLLAEPLKSSSAAGLGGGTLTVRPVPKDKALAGDGDMERLVDALIDARVLVASIPDGDSRPQAAALIGVAHQRVFESWKQAHEILEAHAEYYRIRDDLERQQQNWASNDKDPSYLLPSGPRLASAEKLIANYGGELADGTREFVAESSRLARRKHTRLVVLAAAAASVAVVAILATIGTYYYYNTAQRNYTAARETIDKLIAGITGELVKLSGIRLATVNSALNVIQTAVNTLAQSAGDDPSLQSTRGEMLYGFAKAYQAAGDARETASKADESLTIRAALTNFDESGTAAAKFEKAPAGWRWNLTQSLDLSGDIARDKRGEDPRVYYERALAIRRQLVKEAPENIEWALGLSWSHVRLGDLPYGKAKAVEDPQRGKLLDAARQEYQEALINTIRVLERNRESALVHRELSWNFNKLGDVEMLAGNFAGALDDFTKGACVRRHLFAEKEADTLARRDLAFSLEKLASAKRRADDVEGAHEAYMEAMFHRNTLQSEDPGNALYIKDRSVTLEAIGDHYAGIRNMKAARTAYVEATKVAEQYSARVSDERATKALRLLQEKVKRLDERVGAIPPQNATGEAERVPDTSAEVDIWRRKVASRQASADDCWGTLSKTLPALLPKIAEASAP
jgi:eukaryotic-like serine/threonine-protein kinase